MKKLQKLVWTLGLLLCAIVMHPSVAMAAEKGQDIGKTLPIWFCLPFAGMLLCIAICPLVAGMWWEKNKPYVVIFWSLAFLLPFTMYAGWQMAADQVLEVIFGDYITFIVLLFGLFCVAGNICLEGDLVGTPKLNVLLLLIGTLAIAAFEWNASFAGMSVADKWTQAFFNATCPRTAGFSSVDLASLSVQTLLVYLFLMWVGGGSQSTAGGVKVNAFAVVVLNLVAVLRGSERVEVFGRELSHDSIRRSNATVVMSLGVLFLFIFILSILEPKASLLALTFECVSALSTVGSSLNLTPQLCDASKLLVSLLMFIGRVGLITLMLGIVKQKKNTKYRYPSDNIIIN